MYIAQSPGPSDSGEGKRKGSSIKEVRFHDPLPNKVRPPAEGGGGQKRPQGQQQQQNGRDRSPPKQRQASLPSCTKDQRFYH